jgi:hypothetical protein
MRVTPIAPLLTITVVLAACGGNDSKPAAAQSSQATWSEAQVERLAGLRRNDDLTYRLAGHPECVAANLLRSGAEVQTYKSAGDVVQTNPDGTVGLKLVEQSAACRQLFTRALARVR